MLLTIDIGNTNVTIGLFAGDVLGPRWRMATARDRTCDEYGLQLLGFLDHAREAKGSIEGVVIASVVPPLTRVFVQACQKYFQYDPLVVNAGVKTGVSIRYDDPRQVGADRIVNAAAVLALYGCPACIVDFGTATTFDAISENGEYIGGAISPGIEIAADALFRRAAKLPRVDLLRPPTAIGCNTQHAIQSGLLFGYVGLVEGMVARFGAELGPDMNVIGTGGLVKTFARECTIIQIVAPWLALEGLRIVWALNK